MRRKTDSITHLVKIVAEEVFDEKIKGLIDTDKDYMNTFHAGIVSSLEKAGEYWSPREDEMLEDEVKTALKQIAKNHGRTLHAVVCRVRTKDLVTRHYRESRP